jgi:hypothetical protein
MAVPAMTVALRGFPSINVAGAKFSDRLAIALDSGFTVDYDNRFQPLRTLLSQNRPFAKLDLVDVLGNGVELALAKATKQRHLSQQINLLRATATKHRHGYLPHT